MKVLYYIDNYYQHGGASKALRDLVNANKKNNECVVFCAKNFSSCASDSFPIEIGNAETVLDFFIGNNFDLIHYFRADGGAVLKEMGKLIKKRNIKIPIITTICQKPSFKLFFLSPGEIKASDYIVFIDKAAYNDKYYTFIKESRKKVIYFGSPDDTIEYTAKLLETSPNNKVPVIGRASLLAKCPMDTFEVFDKINNPKEIVIIGGGDNLDKMLKEASLHTDYKTTIKGQLSYQEYLQEMNKFDIFLYYLPLYSHSSIDFTLGEAMLLEKPCIYYGPDAPKERFVNKVNGFVAQSKEELAEYCNILIGCPELRREIGKKARISTIENFSYDKTVGDYNELYNYMLTVDTNSRIKVPLSLFFYYRRNRTVIFLKRAFNKCLRELGIKYQISYN